MSRRVRPPTPLTPERAWDYALSLLGRRAHSAAEVRQRLLRRSLDEAEAERVVARLEELQLLDDRAFAEAYVRARSGSRGRLSLRSELRRKGVGERLVDEALAERTDAEQLAAAELLLSKQAWRFQAAFGAEPKRAAAARVRAFALLARRGFPSDAAREAVAAVLGEQEGGAADA